MKRVPVEPSHHVGICDEGHSLTTSALWCEGAVDKACGPAPGSTAVKSSAASSHAPAWEPERALRVRQPGGRGAPALHSPASAGEREAGAELSVTALLSGAWHEGPARRIHRQWRLGGLRLSSLRTDATDRRRPGRSFPVRGDPINRLPLPPVKPSLRRRAAIIVPAAPGRSPRLKPWMDRAKAEALDSRSWSLAATTIEARRQPGRQAASGGLVTAGRVAAGVDVCLSVFLSLRLRVCVREFRFLGSSGQRGSRPPGRSTSRIPRADIETMPYRPDTNRTTIRRLPRPGGTDR